MRATPQNPEIYSYGIGRDYGEGEFANFIADVQGRDLGTEQKSIVLEVYNDQSEYLDHFYAETPNIETTVDYRFVIEATDPTDKPLIHYIDNTSSGSRYAIRMNGWNRGPGYDLFDLRGKLDVYNIDAGNNSSAIGVANANISGCISEGCVIHSAEDADVHHAFGIDLFRSQVDPKLFDNCASRGTIQALNGGVAADFVISNGPPADMSEEANFLVGVSSVDYGVILVGYQASLDTILRNVLIENATTFVLEYPTGTTYNTTIETCAFNQGVQFDTDGITPLSDQVMVIDQGTAISGINYDVYGNPRPRGVAVDIGAVEVLVTNQPPNAPTSPSPTNDATGIMPGTIPLSCIVSDPDGDNLDVSFYDASDDSLIGTVIGIASGNNVSLDWTNREEGQTYNWYVKVTDGTETTQGPTWSFTTANIITDNIDISAQTNTSASLLNIIWNLSSNISAQTNTANSLLNVLRMLNASIAVQSITSSISLSTYNLNHAITADLQHYIHNFIVTSIVNKHQVAIPVDIEPIFLEEGTIIGLLFDESFTGSSYKYRYQAVSKSQWPYVVKQRLSIYPAPQYFQAVDSANGLNVFGLQHDDLTMADVLLKYRNDSTSVVIVNDSTVTSIDIVTSEDVTTVTASVNSFSTSLSKLIFLYLDLKINENYSTYFLTSGPISNSNEVLATCFELKLIDDYFQYINTKSISLDSST